MIRNFFAGLYVVAIVGLHLVLGSGCGAAPEDATVEDTAEAPQIGKLEQRLSYYDGYGVLDNMNRCWTNNHATDWVGGHCNMPNPVKRYYYNKRPSTCTGTYAADYAAAMNTAVSIMSSELTVAGWTVLSSSPTCTGSVCTGNTVTVECGTPFAGTGSNAAGGTEIHVFPLVDCTSTQDGQRCNFGDTISRLYLSKVNSTMSGVTSSTARRKYMTAVFVHELGHSAGLGHEDGTPNGEANCLAPGLPVPGGAQMMDPGGCQGGLTPAQWFQPSLTSFERDMLAAYH